MVDLGELPQDDRLRNVKDDADARDKFDQTLVFRHRLRMVRDVITEKVMAPFSGDLVAIIDRIGALALERDRIIHGTWSSDQPAPPERVRAPMISDTRFKRSKTETGFRVEARL